MGPKILTVLLALVAISLVGWVVSLQISNRRLVFEGIDSLRSELISAFPEGEERAKADATVTRYVESAAGFERRVSRSELFLSRQLLLAATADASISVAEANAILDTMQAQMIEAGTTVLIDPTGRTQ
ncbi:MAG: hypothetical protein CME06_00425 [Gemmatimonadetes bacterium]|nr:hypothetical protein [Gemmatimonadota bacterium]